MKNKHLVAKRWAGKIAGICLIALVGTASRGLQLYGTLSMYTSLGHTTYCFTGRVKSASCGRKRLLSLLQYYSAPGTSGAHGMANASSQISKL